MKGPCACPTLEGIRGGGGGICMPVFGGAEGGGGGMLYVPPAEACRAPGCAHGLPPTPAGVAGVPRLY